MHSEIWWVFSGPTTVATDGVMFIKEKIQTEFASKVLAIEEAYFLSLSSLCSIDISFVFEYIDSTIIIKKALKVQNNYCTVS